MFYSRKSMMFTIASERLLTCYLGSLTFITLHLLCLTGERLYLHSAVLNQKNRPVRKSIQLMTSTEASQLAIAVKSIHFARISQRFVQSALAIAHEC